jgi:hypothetical protein
MAGVPRKRRRQPGCISCTPKRFLGFVNNVAPRQSDIVQVAIGPMGQFAALALTIAPDVNGFSELRQKTRLMIIYHRFL